MAEAYGSGYNKRPLWQWIVLYLIVGLLLYGLIYYFFLAKKSGYSTSTTPTTTQSAGVPHDNIYTMRTDPSKGTYLSDFQGRALYTYDQDSSGVSNCTGACLSDWPAYTSGATAESTLPENITVIKRNDGSTQFAWKGMPLYYFVSDTTAGQITGDGVEGFHLAK